MILKVQHLQEIRIIKDAISTGSTKLVS